MNSIKNAVKQNAQGNLKKLLIEQKLNSLFKLSNAKREERYGLHASAIIASDSEFCYREQLLSLFYKQNQGSELSVGTLRIFKEGNTIHEKWQNMFKEHGIAKSIEVTRFDERYDLSYTPDAEIELFGEEPLVEIKSMNTFAFKKATSHPSGEKQCNFYLYLRKKSWGFVLAEDKNTQEIQIFIVQYDKEKARPYVARLKEIQMLKKEFIENHTVPPRKCKQCTDKRAINCVMRDACFKVGIGRVKIDWLGKKRNDGLMIGKDQKSV